MIRIMVERHLKEGKRRDQPGYVTGETLASTEDPSTIMVMSTWQSLDVWKAWEKTEPRIKIYEKIEPLLLEKPKISVYQVMAA